MKCEEMLGLRLLLVRATQSGKCLAGQILMYGMEIGRLQDLLQYYEDEWDVYEFNLRVWSVELGGKW